MDILALDIAYSVEVDDYIDPDRAYDLFWSGVITDKKKFLCPGDGCVAQVTCANLDGDVQDMKVVPHYRIYGAHSEQCEIFNNVPLDLQHEDSASVKEEKRSLEESIVDVFLTERPASYYDENKSDYHAPEKSIKKHQRIKSTSGSVLRENGCVGHVYSVRTMVSRYIRYRKDGTLVHRKVNIQGKDVSYSSIFKCIWEQNLEKLPDFPVVYYGWAFINKLPFGYQIKFKKHFKNGNEEYPTTVMIYDNLIASYKIKKLVLTRIEKINKKASPTAFVFIYGKPVITKSKAGKEYANFSMKNLDMIDINQDCPLPAEYDK